MIYDSRSRILLTVRNFHLFNHWSNDFDMVYFTEKLKTRYARGRAYGTRPTWTIWTRKCWPICGRRSPEIFTPIGICSTVSINATEVNKTSLLLHNVLVIVIVFFYSAILFIDDIVRFFRTVTDVKKKWTNIKESFVKDVKGNKPRKSLYLPEHRKKYYLFDHLQFLIPFIQDTKAGGGGRSANNGVGKPTSKKMSKNTCGKDSSRNGPSVSATETAPKIPETLQPDV